MSKDEVLVKHILDAIAKIEVLVSRGKKVFDTDETVQDSIIRKLEIIGKATKNLSPDLRVIYPSIPWKQIAGLRDVLIHQYFGVDLENVWKIAKKRLPKLKMKYEVIMEHINILKKEEDNLNKSK